MQRALGALSGNIGLDALAGLGVCDYSLGGELLRGEGPVTELGGAAVEVVFGELHGWLGWGWGWGMMPAGETRR